MTAAGGWRGTAPTSPSRVRRAGRQAEALRLRIEGASSVEIAAALGVSRVTAWRLVSAALADLKAEIDESSETLRAIEAGRLNAITEILWPRVLDGDLKAIDRVLRARESFRRLTGLDLVHEPVTQGPPATYVLASGDVSLVPPGVSWIDTRLPSQRPELMRPVVVVGDPGPQE